MIVPFHYCLCQINFHRTPQITRFGDALSGSTKRDIAKHVDSGQRCCIDAKSGLERAYFPVQTGSPEKTIRIHFCHSFKKACSFADGFVENGNN